MESFFVYVAIAVVIVLNILPLAVSLLIAWDTTYIPSKSRARRWLSLLIPGVSFASLVEHDGEVTV